VATRVKASLLRVSDKGLAFIGAFEGYRRYPYNDAAGHATIGYGHLLHLGPVTARDRARYPAGLTQAAALKLLRRDAANAEYAVHHNVHALLNQHEYDALVSFTFNCGGGALANSSALRLLNQGDRDQVPGKLMLWDKAGGRVLEGLRRRRAAEGRMFAHGTYSTT
jgi:lysozyme